jgi:hypothetical protein
MNASKSLSQPSSPLDLLVTSQLATLSACEEQLQQRYHLLLRRPNADDSQIWARDLLSLQVRTDRLNRLVDAISLS